MCKCVYIGLYKWNDYNQLGHFFGTLKENDYNIGFIIVNRIISSGEFYRNRIYTTDGCTKINNNIYSRQKIMPLTFIKY